MNREGALNKLPPPPGPFSGSESPTYLRFKDLIQRPEGFALDEAALVLAQQFAPSLDVEGGLGQLDRMASDLSRRLERLDDPSGILAAFRRCLHEEMGFRGNSGNYYDPLNSLLHAVLQRRLGIPITLSLIYMELGRRLGLAIRGIGLPGHFVVRIDAGQGSLYADPFRGGVPMETEDCRRLVRRLCGDAMEFRPSMIDPASARSILLRMLRNLKAIGLQRGELLSVLGLVERILLLDPGNLQEVRDRGILYTLLECHQSAQADLEYYLQHSRDEAEKETIRRRLRQLTQSRHTLH